MYVLVFTLMTTGQVAFYSGDQENRQRNAPTLFPTEALCEEVRGPQVQKMIASREANPKLPAFKLECMSQDAAPPVTKPDLKKA